MTAEESERGLSFRGRAVGGGWKTPALGSAWERHTHLPRTDAGLYGPQLEFGTRIGGFAEGSAERWCFEIRKVSSAEWLVVSRQGSKQKRQ